MLTGQCKTDFHNWLYDKHRLVYTDLYEMSEGVPSMVNTLIVDWFDSIKYIIDVQPVYGYGKNSYAVSNWIANLVCSDLQLALVDLDITGFVSRPDAITAAIEKANEIYNQSN